MIEYLHLFLLLHASYTASVTQFSLNACECVSMPYCKRKKEWIFISFLLLFLPSFFFILFLTASECVKYF